MERRRTNNHGSNYEGCKVKIGVKVLVLRVFEYFFQIRNHTCWCFASGIMYTGGIPRNIDKTCDIPHKYQLILLVMSSRRL